MLFLYISPRKYDFQFQPAVGLIFAILFMQTCGTKATQQKGLYRSRSQRERYY
jgi:hypothetical protein